MKGERGQVALEFVTTYGWSVMVVLMVIGVMAYYGFIQTDSFLPEYCQIEPTGISCVEFTGSISGDALRFGFQNNLAEDLSWAEVTVNSPYCDNMPITKHYDMIMNGKRLLQPGETFTSLFPCDGLSTTKMKGSIKIEFLKMNEETTHISNGDFQIKANE